MVPVNFNTDYNVIQADSGAFTGGAPNRFVPDAKSSAIDAGLDLSTYFHGKPLPGCEPGYFKGKAPDAGAEEVR